jgi:hypothetical protein
MASQDADKISQSPADSQDNHNGTPTSKDSTIVFPNRPPLEQLTDRSGNTFYFGNAGDYWHPAFPLGSNADYRTHVQTIRDMDIRSDDILICSYPKTGLHWTMEIMAMLMKNKVEHADDSHVRAGFLDQRPIPLVDAVPSPRVLFTHVPFRHLPKQVFQKKIKILLLDRNPKDVLVSYYTHWNMRKPPVDYPGTFEQFFQLYMELGFFYGHYFDYMLDWQNGIEANPNLDVFVSVFEDMKLDPVEGVKRLNKYLDTGCSDELCEDIAIACSFQNLKEFKDKHTPESLKANLRVANASMYRKGEVGDWKNWFTVAMNETFDEEYNKRMKNYKREYKFTLP